MSAQHTLGPRPTLPPFPRDYAMVMRATNECALQNRRMSSLIGTDRVEAAKEVAAIAKAAELRTIYELGRSEAFK